MKQALRYNNKVIKKIYQADELVKKMNYGQSSDVFQYIKNDGDTPTPPAPVPYDEQYLTIESTSDNNTISWKSSASSLLTTISASTDNGVTWTEYTAKVGGTALATLNTGDKLLVKGENATYSNKWIGWRGGNNSFSSTNAFEVKGNIMSLVSGDSFTSADKLTAGYTFYSLFSGCTHLISAENLILAADTLADYCYGNMFYKCTSLTTAPSVLPATTLANSCYYSMFDGCTSLTKAPVLPANYMVNYCYRQMFVNCRKLNYIKCLAIDKVQGSSPTIDWLSGVSSTGTFIKAASMNDWTTGNNGIPSGWSIVNA